MATRARTGGSHVGAKDQGPDPPWAALPGHEKGARWEVEQLGQESTPMWNAGTAAR